MQRALLVRLRPTTPWRIAPDSGARHQAGTLYRSDSLYSAVTHAMDRLGMVEEWLEATARVAEAPAVRFSSCFPWRGETLFIVPPRSTWPPATPSRLRAKGASFVPTALVPSLCRGEIPNEEAFVVDGHSRCLLPRSENPEATEGPFRSGLRSFQPVDRIQGATGPAHRAACVEFAAGAGLWLLVAFGDEDGEARWSGPVEAALRLLADSGFGGKRSLGWGRAEISEVTRGSLPGVVLPEFAPYGTENPEDAGETAPAPFPGAAYWLLSLFRPGPRDRVDWGRGDYSFVTRAGRIESAAAWGTEKKQLRMIEEGSVLFAENPLEGSAADVAPDGFPHPVFRYGFPISIPISPKVVQ